MRNLVLAVVGLATVVVSGCTTQAVTPAPPPSHLDASITQFRFQEGSRTLRAGIQNLSGPPVRITRARVLWPGFRWPEVRLEDRPLTPTLTSAFDVELGPPVRCSDRLPAAARIRATVDGTPRTLPLRVEDSGLLLRMHENACWEHRLDAAATVTMRISDREVVRQGEPYLAATVTVTRHGTSAEPLKVVDLSGSVLFRLRATFPPAPTTSSFRLPFLVGSNHRCDGHARGQSQQSFLWGLYLRLGGSATHRHLLMPTTAEQNRLLLFLDRACAGSPQIQ